MDIFVPLRPKADELGPRRNPPGAATTRDNVLEYDPDVYTLVNIRTETVQYGKYGGNFAALITLRFIIKFRPGHRRLRSFHVSIEFGNHETTDQTDNHKERSPLELPRVRALAPEERRGRIFTEEREGDVSAGVDVPFGPSHGPAKVGLEWGKAMTREHEMKLSGWCKSSPRGTDNVVVWDCVEAKKAAKGVLPGYKAAIVVQCREDTPFQAVFKLDAERGIWNSTSKLYDWMAVFGKKDADDPLIFYPGRPIGKAVESDDFQKLNLHDLVGLEPISKVPESHPLSRYPPVLAANEAPKIMSLRETLLDQKHKFGFISVKALEELITPSSIQKILRDGLAQHIGETINRPLMALIPRARKCIALLIIAKFECQIRDVIDREITDAIFPLQDTQITAIFPMLDSEGRSKLLEEQWTIPPVLRQNEHLEFPEGAPLPFLRKQRDKHGSFGLVFKVKIADGHLDTSWSGHTVTSDLAVKEVEVDEGRMSDVMQEITALQHRRHPGIVPLLASFTKHKTESGYESKSISMIFPYAEMDMEMWLNLSAPPAHLAYLSRPDQRVWLYKMMSQLLESLAYLHSEIDRQVMCHHDLKPRNILVIGKSLVIADLGFSQLVSLSRGRGSGVDGGERLGTTTYRPPEYYKEDSWDRREGQTFGRAFDIWAMGCIMIQVAVLIVWGWESGKVREFQKARTDFLLPMQAGPGATRGSSTDDSFVKSVAVLDTWLSLLQKEDGSIMLKEYLAIAVQMLRQDPSDRISSWEAALDLHELLHPDATKSARFQKTADLVQKPTISYKTENFETPLHRAAASGNLVRVIELAEAGWSAEQLDKSGRTPLDLAELQGDQQLNEVMRRAKKIHQSGRKYALQDLPHEPTLQLQEKRGFKLSKMPALKLPDRALDCQVDKADYVTEFPEPV